MSTPNQSPSSSLTAQPPTPSISSPANATVKMSHINLELEPDEEHNKINQNLALLNEENQCETENLTRSEAGNGPQDDEDDEENESKLFVMPQIGF